MNTPTIIQPSQQSESLLAILLAAVEDMKAMDVEVIDVRERSNLIDYMVIASGTSSRHLAAVVEKVALVLKQHQLDAHHFEGNKDSEWVLLDCSEVVLHVMLPEAREYYDLEGLWLSPIPELESENQ